MRITRIRPAGVAGVLAAFVLAAGVVGLAGQPPKQDEKEDPKGGVKKKIVDPDDEDEDEDEENEDRNDEDEP